MIFQDKTRNGYFRSHGLPYKPSQNGRRKKQCIQVSAMTGGWDEGGLKISTKVSKQMVAIKKPVGTT